VETKPIVDRLDEIRLSLPASAPAETPTVPPIIEELKLARDAMLEHAQFDGMVALNDAARLYLYLRDLLTGGLERGDLRLAMLAFIAPPAPQTPEETQKLRNSGIPEECVNSPTKDGMVDVTDEWIRRASQQGIPATAAPAETPEALCVCGHRHFTHAIRPSGDTCMVTGCNCGEWRPAPPVAPSAPATTGGDMRTVLLRIIDNYGPWHDDDCPGDDTCDCSCKPLSDEINRVLKASEGALESAPSPMEAHAANAMTVSGEAERRVVDDVDGKWTVSNDGERFWDTFETREEAVAEIAESGGWVGICDSIKPGDYAKGHADRIIEEISTRLSEEVGDVADQQPIYTDADEKRLDEEIASVVERWMVGRVTCHRVLKVEEVPAQPTPALSDTEKQAMLQRLMVKYDAMRQAKKPTPAPSQDAEQTPVKGVDRG
jgi:hypothetical protein